MPGGRPKKTIDYDTVYTLASVMCTQEEISSHLGIHVRTLQRDAEFCRIYNNGIENAKTSIRRNQFILSKTNAAVAIWLGKQYLGQRDIQDVNMQSNVNLTQISNDKLDEIEKILGSDE